MTLQKRKKGKKKPMLYIFRYFKEIQKGIFVIKTMFEMVVWVDLRCAKSCEDILPPPPPLLFSCHFKMTSHPALPKQSCQFALIFPSKWIFVRSYVVCVFFFPFLSVVSLPNESKHRSPLSEAMLMLSDKTHLIQLVVWLFEVIRCVKRGTDRKKPSPVKVAWPERRQYVANWALL